MTSVGKANVLKSNSSVSSISSLTSLNYSSQNCVRMKDSSRDSTPVSLGMRPSALEIDELPDRACLGRKISLKYDPMQQNGTDAIREAAYVGSFPVDEETQEARAEYIRKHLQDMQLSMAKPVLLAISLSGIKVCCSSGESVYMAHALKRISYATCDPAKCQFSFLAREPKIHTSVQYCHTFRTKLPTEAEELNGIVANAFKMAYRGQNVDAVIRQPSFHDLIQNQIESQREQFEVINRQKQEFLMTQLSQISTPQAGQMAQERRECRERRHKKELDDLSAEMDELKKFDPVAWAKQVVEKSQNNSSFAKDSISAIPPSISCSNMSLASPVASSTANMDVRNVSAVSRILNALNSGSLRSHGSPVTILKDAIDEHFRVGLNGALLRSPTLAVGEDLSPVDPDPLTSAASSQLASQSRFRGSSIVTPDGCKMGSSNDLAFVRSSSSQQSIRCEMRSSPSLSERQRTDQSGFVRSDHSAFVTPRSEAFPKAEFENGDSYGEPTYKNCRPENNCSDGNLSEATWYQPGVPREIALDILTRQDVGSFVVRDSSTHPGCYALSIKVPKYDETSNEITHYLITRTSKGSFKIKGLTKEWSSLTALVLHHTIMRELLPCLLILPSPKLAS